MKATNEIKNQIREAHDQKTAKGYQSFMRFVKPSIYTEAEKEEPKRKAKEMTKAEAKDARKLSKKVNTRKEFIIKELLKDCQYQSRKQKLSFLIKRAEEETAGELAKEEPSNSKLNTLSAVIEDSKNELELFRIAEQEAEEAYRISNNFIECRSMADFMNLDDTAKESLLHRSIRYKLKQYNAHVDKDGNSAPLPEAFIIDEPYFNAQMDKVTSIMFIKLAETWSKYRTDTEYAEEINAKAEAYTMDAWRIICGRSADSALRDFYRNEVKGSTYKRKLNGQTVLDLQAYETEAPEDWQTEKTAVLNVYVESIAQNDREEKIFALLDAGYQQNEIAEIMDMSTPTVNRIVTRLHSRIQCDRMTNVLDAQDAKEARETARENDKYALRAYIMKGIQAGMNYSRIADHMRIEDSRDKYDQITTTKEEKIRKMLKGVDVQKLLQVEHLKPQTLPRVPKAYIKAGDKTTAPKAYRISHADQVEAIKATAGQLQTIRAQYEAENDKTAKAIRKAIIRHRRKEGYKTPEAVQKAPETVRKTVNTGFTDEALQTLRRKLEKAQETEKAVRAYRERMRYINSPEGRKAEAETA